MATGAIGGTPTSSLNTFAFSSSLTNYVFYTCPANTYAMVNFRMASNYDFSGTTVSALGWRTTDGAYFQYNSFGAFSLSGFSGGQTGLNYSIQLAPGESLYLSASYFGGTARITYALTEVTAG